MSLEEILKFKERAPHCGSCSLSSCRLMHVYIHTYTDTYIHMSTYIHRTVLDGGRKGSRDVHVMVSDHSFFHSFILQILTEHLITRAGPAG